MHLFVQYLHPRNEETLSRGQKQQGLFRILTFLLGDVKQEKDNFHPSQREDKIQQQVSHPHIMTSNSIYWLKVMVCMVDHGSIIYLFGAI